MKSVLLVFLLAGCAHTGSVVLDTGCFHSTYGEAQNKMLKMVKKTCGCFVDGLEEGYKCYRHYSNEELGHGLRYTVDCDCSKSDEGSF